MAIATSHAVPSSRELIRALDEDNEHPIHELTSAILDEWPEVTEEDVESAHDHASELISTIARKTGHTRMLVARQLVELKEMQGRPETRFQTTARRIGKALERAETRTRQSLSHASDEIRREALATGRKARAAVESNMWMSLFTVLGLGFVIGFLTRRRG